jgi:hypothetical protein
MVSASEMSPTISKCMRGSFQRTARTSIHIPGGKTAKLRPGTVPPSSLSLRRFHNEFLSSLVYARHESGGLPAGHSFIEAVNELHSGDDLSKLTEAA